MSYTEIFGFNKRGKAESIGITGNSHRGAMAIWRYLEDTYLPKFSDYEYATRVVSLNGKNSIQEIWDLVEKDILDCDRIALATTFDKMTVKDADIEKVIKAFIDCSFMSSLKEQAEILQKAHNSGLYIAYGWNQTSVNGDDWSNFNGYNEKTDNSIPYNIKKQNEHYDIFEVYEKYMNKTIENL